MMITINLAPETEEKLRQRAAQSGQTVDSFVRQLVEREVLGVNGGPPTAPPSPGPAASNSGTTLDEVLAPLREGFERSGMTEEELTHFLTEVRDEARREKRARKSS
jgi:plasmid stability protein